MSIINKTPPLGCFWESLLCKYDLIVLEGRVDSVSGLHGSGDQCHRKLIQEATLDGSLQWSGAKLRVSSLSAQHLFYWI